MKDNYENLEMEIIWLEEEDIITVSGCSAEIPSGDWDIINP